MGTRSMIGKTNKDGTITAIYCHWDGYPEHNGQILKNFYKKESKVNKLMKLGNLSSLGEDIGKKHKFDQYINGICTAYGRDRGEKDQQAETYDSIDSIVNHYGGIEYVYIWFNEEWRCFDSNLTPVDLYSSKLG